MQLCNTSYINKQKNLFVNAYLYINTEKTEWGKLEETELKIPRTLIYTGPLNTFFVLKVSYHPPISFCLGNSHSSFKTGPEYIKFGGFPSPSQMQPTTSPLVLPPGAVYYLYYTLKKSFLRTGTLSLTFIFRRSFTANQKVPLLGFYF